MLNGLFDRRKTVLDEREMLEMYRVEHFGLWLMYALLCAAILIQLLMGADLAQLAGEITAVGVTSVAMILNNARRGIWDVRSRPSMRGNAVYSLACCVLTALVLAALGRGVKIVLLAGLGIGAGCMLVLTALMLYMKRRQEKADRELDEEPNG